VTPGIGNSLRLAVVYGFGVALLFSNFYTVGQLASFRNQLTSVTADLAAAKTEIANLKSTTVSSTKAAGRSLNAIRAELKDARSQAETATGQVKAGAVKRAEELTSELARRLVDEQARNERLQAQLKRDISHVEEATLKADSKLGEVSTEVVAVKSEVADNRRQLEKTVADLRRVKGDMGVQSGQIATNQKELNALKALGEKNYFEFDIKGRETSTIAGVKVVLKRTDPKKFRFTLDVYADDKRVEKKDRLVNEPVQFMITKVRQPYSLEVNELYEIVVNEVGKDRIKGYLAAPRSTSPAL
jgi:predicted  nucleic acid-binding Zn-ribbon protein